MRTFLQYKMDKYYITWLRTYWKPILIGLIVCAIGLFIINQWIDFRFKVQLLSYPCDICISMGYECKKYMPIEQLIFNWTQ
jgi:hypothetical protein